MNTDYLGDVALASPRPCNLSEVAGEGVADIPQVAADGVNLGFLLNL